jgi:hypothetical protein
MEMTEKELLDGIDKSLEQVFSRGDPWGLSDEGVAAITKRTYAGMEALVGEIKSINDDAIRKRSLKSLYEFVLSIVETIVEFHNIEQSRVKQAYVAQSFNKLKADNRNRELITCIEAEAAAQNRVLSKGLKFAQLIRPGVRRRLGLEPDEANWPSASTIKAAVMRVKSTL